MTAGEIKQQSIVRQSCVMSAINAINQFVEYRDFKAEATNDIIISIAKKFYNWVFKEGESDVNALIVRQSTLKVAIESIKSDNNIKKSEDILAKADELLKWVSI